MSEKIYPKTNEPCPYQEYIKPLIHFDEFRWFVDGREDWYMAAISNPKNEVMCGYEAYTDLVQRLVDRSLA